MSRPEIEHDWRGNAPDDEQDEPMVRSDSCLRAIWTAIASHAKPLSLFLLAVLIVAAIST